MTEKALRKKILKLGGTIQKGNLLVSFPDTLRINNRQEALNALEIMRYCDDLEGPEEEKKPSYTLSLDEPLDALIDAIQKKII